MADSSSGRNPATNSGSDSAKHYKGTAQNQYHGVKPTPLSTSEGGSIVGNGKPGKAPEASDIK
jgi:hypothetical protein